MNVTRGPPNSSHLIHARLRANARGRKNRLRDFAPRRISVSSHPESPSPGVKRETTTPGIIGNSAILSPYRRFNGHRFFFVFPFFHNTHLETIFSSAKIQLVATTGSHAILKIVQLTSSRKPQRATNYPQIIGRPLKVWILWSNLSLSEKVVKDNAISRMRSPDVL